MKPSYEELEARCAALAAENAGLKEACGGDGSYRDCPACAHSEYIEAPETPTTDAFLAEVRAAAVDEVCLKISNAIINCYQDEMVGLDAAAAICGDFASGLRKGVQS
ncbi:hypothetical protein ABHD38_00010 [Enterobacter cloacae]|uniref:hypothetical protein n=1 Tax=Enterobacter cloacae TaxID=550 RepID=UPI00325BC5B0